MVLSKNVLVLRIYAEVFKAEGHDVCNLLSIGSAIIIISGTVV